VRCQVIPLKDAQIVALVVTRDRRILLGEALTAIRSQTRPPDAVVVVDNASADGTAAMVRARFPETDLLALPANTGGAGGFAIGLAHALDLGAGAVWLMDDDTLPEPGALAALLAARERATGPDGPPPVVASRVVWTDGRDHPMNTPRTRP
jgi:rhamnopyranosyl-N-acetylglucosaminyl-diphospho-decaprenol beta-1,3/1,4-galactofuranosyltransferase